MDLFVFEAAPQPLGEQVVRPNAFDVHSDGMAGENAGERRTGELQALIGVEDLRLVTLPDVSPKFYPAMSSFLAFGLPFWAGGATGAGAEPST